MSNSVALSLFTLFVLAMLALDLGVFQRDPHKISIREAAYWYVIWVSLAIAFNIGIYFWRGQQPALEFLTGYVLEVSLSTDNVFVFAVIFGYMAVKPEFQHRVLFWGIIGALVMRAAFIAAGAALVTRFHWVLYVFGAFLVITGLKLFRHEEEIHPERNPLLRLARKLFPITPGYEGASFFVMREGRRFATPMLLVLVLVESTDVLFAVDSIPAIFSVTLDPFIIYTSNVFAILGLRSLYFILSGAITKFRFLRPGLAVVLIFVGVKMLIADFYKIHILVSLGVIVAVLAVAIGASVLRAPKADRVTKQL